MSENAPDLKELRQRLARTLEGRYEITRLLGRGGMAVVFLAEDLVLERQVAIKVLPPDMTRDAQLVTRFQQEAKTAAKLDHPNIIPIYRVESEAGLVYIVMKYVSGQSLEDLLAKGPLPITRVRQVLREAALALGHAHRRRIVHRDVKPANIMLDDEGRVILTDFGISKAVQDTGQLTGTGKIIGTPHYMAPEQARGQAVDGRADQYALAIVGHRVLTGRLPFDGPSHSVLYQQVHEQPPRVLDRRPDTPADLRVALDRALAKDSKARFKTMEQFAAAVSGERSGPTTVVSEPVKAAGPVKSAGGHGAGVFVAWATVAAVVAAVWLGVPGLQSMVEGDAPARKSVTSKPVSPRAAGRRPVAPVSSSAERKRGPAKLSSVRYALLRVDSDPSGVLYVDGVKVGVTPVANRRVPFGTHRLRIERKGYQTLTETIVVKGTGPITRRYDLRRRQGR
ncbi:MAG TPA: serine/threonine-protein kinase [Gemmatimonadales bacterium]|nr:serine/threonine-protein kinase [Gemmatimonadales bacterium]